MFIGAFFVVAYALLNQKSASQKIEQYFRQTMRAFEMWCIVGFMLFATVWYFRNLDTAISVLPFMMGFAFSRAFSGGWQNPRSRWQTIMAAIIMLGLAYFFNMAWPHTEKYWIWYLLIGVALDGLIRFFRSWHHRNQTAA